MFPIVWSWYPQVRQWIYWIATSFLRLVVVVVVPSSSSHVRMMMMRMMRMMMDYHHHYYCWFPVGVVAVLSAPLGKTVVVWKSPFVPPAVVARELFWAQEEA
jgi:hypothetical protein